MTQGNTEPFRQTVLSADRPKETLGQDLLGYAPFAKAVAKAIQLAKSTDGLVFAVHGPWGSGKTSAVNMVVDALRLDQHDVSEDQHVLVVRFNPWWFSEQQDLTRAFFDELSAALGGAVPDEVVTRLKRVAKHVVRGKEAFLGLLDLIPGGSLGKGLLDGVLNAIGEGLEEQRSLDEERTALADALREQGKRILVIVDDIDRLPPNEARQIFRLVKSVADLPNVIYLLVFDRKVAAEALRNDATADGPHWLEKIVQASFDLPPVNKLDLRQFFLGTLQSLLDTVDHGDQAHWFNVYIEAVEPWLRTPRDVTRLCNALAVSYPPVAHDVNFADLIALETLRLFEPGLYDVVRESCEQITGLQSDTSYRQPSDIGDRLLRAVAPDREQRARRALKRLFPRLEAVWGNTSYHHDFLRTWDRQRRCCVARHFRTYFAFSTSEDVLTRQELDAAIAAFHNPEAAEDLVRRYTHQIRRTGGTKAALLLEELRVVAPDLPQDQVRPLLINLLQVADYFLNPKDEDKGFFSLPQIWIVDSVVDAFIDRLPAEERALVLAGALRRSSGLSVLVFIVFSMAREHGRHTEKGAKPEDQRRLSEEEVLDLEALVADRLSSAAMDRSLLLMPGALSLIFSWAVLAGNEAVRRWTDDLLDEEDAAVRLAAIVTTMSKVQAGDDPRVHLSPRVDRQSLSPLLDVDRLMERLREIEPSTDEDSRVAITQFREGLERNDHDD